MGFELADYHIRGVIDASKYTTLKDAVDALPAEGGVVIIPAGFTATIGLSSQVALGTKTVHIIGQGSLRSATNRSVINFIDAPATPTSGFTGSNTYTGLTLKNLVFTATTANSNWVIVSANDNNRIGLYMKNCYVAGYNIRRVHTVFYYCPGFIIEDVETEVWDTAFPMWANNINGLFVYNKIRVNFPSSPDLNAYGFYLRRDPSTSPVFYNECYVYRAGANRGAFEFGNTAPPVFMTNCVADSCKGFGISIFNEYASVWTHPITIRNFIAINNSRHGIYIWGTDSTKKVKADIEGAYLINNGYDSPYNYDGICIGNYIDEISIRNCLAISDGTRQRYACNFSGGTEINIKEYVGNDWTNGYKSGGAAEYWHPSIDKSNIEIENNHN